MAVKDKLVTLEDLQTAYNELKGMIEEMGGGGEVSSIDLAVHSPEWFACNGIHLTKYGHWVEITIKDLTAANSTVSIGNTIAIIPEGYRPKQDVFVEMVGVSTGYASVVKVLGIEASNGQIMNLSTIMTEANNYHGFYICE